MEIEVKHGASAAMEETKPVKKPRARRAKAKENVSVSKLIAALKFVGQVQKKAGSVQQQFSAIINHWLVASNGVVTIATKVEEDFNLCPHTHQLLDALNKSGAEMNMTQLSPEVLSVKSEKFKALVPCCAFEELFLPGPDAKLLQVNDALKAALEAVAGLATEGASLAHYAGVLLQSGSVVSTNGHTILEYWHGLQIEGVRFIIPKAAAVAVAKCDKQLTDIGYSESSVTFHFEDESFIKTQVFQEQFPAYQQHFASEGTPLPISPDFFKGVNAVESFSKDGIVYFTENGILSKENENEATTYKVEGLPDGMAFDAEYLLKVEHAMQQVYFDKQGNRAIFFGENIRGVLGGVAMAQSYKPDYEATEEEVGF